MGAPHDGWLLYRAWNIPAVLLCEIARIKQFVLRTRYISQAPVARIRIVEVNPNIQIWETARVWGVLVSEYDRMWVLVFIEDIHLQWHGPSPAKIFCNRHHRGAGEQVQGRVCVYAQHIIETHEPRSDRVLDNARSMNRLSSTVRRQRFGLQSVSQYTPTFNQVRRDSAGQGHEPVRQEFFLLLGRCCD